MRYNKLSNEELGKFKYPNLIAELIESGYSICTLGEHLGLGRYRKQNDPQIWGKIRGDGEPITMSDAVALSKLFGAKMEYLFSHELRTLSDMPAAYWRWFDDNKKKDEEIKLNEEVREIERRLRESSVLLRFVKYAVTCSNEELQQLIDSLDDKKAMATQ